ncbi:MAG: PepSY domain-containing protein [Bacteroidota bacterium]
MKKDIALLQPPTQKGAQKDLSQWKPIAELADSAKAALYAAHPEQIDNPIDRIDVRPTKGMVKVLFDQGHWEVQLDAATGQVLSIAKRHSDWIEALHDGSIVNDAFKLLSMNFLGFGLLLLVASGFWLWYGPKQLRRLKKRFRRKIKSQQHHS